MDLIPDTQPHLRQIAESAKSFCVRFDYERLRLIAQEIFMSSSSELFEAVFKGLYKQK